jgi:hypothetical protein
MIDVQKTGNSPLNRTCLIRFIFRPAYAFQPADAFRPLSVMLTGCLFVSTLGDSLLVSAKQAHRGMLSGTFRD